MKSKGRSGSMKNSETRLLSFPSGTTRVRGKRDSTPPASLPGNYLLSYSVLFGFLSQAPLKLERK
jgi:hypothetical protein